MRHSIAAALTAAAVLLTGTAAEAELTLGTPFSDHAVLQRDMDLPIWGWAEPGQEVTVAFKGRTARATADDTGKWRVELDPLDADAEPAVMTVTAGDETVEVGDVLVGEVWLCSGQSNMAWTVGRYGDADDAIAAADRPLIRHIKARSHFANLPQDTVDAKWKVASPETVGNWTAVGYYFASVLQRELGVPVGLVNASWGGTRIEPWTPIQGFEQVEATRSIYEDLLLQDPSTPAYKRTAGEYVQKVAQWAARSAAAIEQDRAIEPAPDYPADLKPYDDRQKPSVLYNAMIHPFVPYAIRGAIWYQGEANHGDGMAYLDKTRALLAGWRAVWGRPDLPYYYVQLAPYKYGNESPHILPEFWEAQAAIEQEIDHTGMVVISDIGDTGNIHPHNKRGVGRRLANLALSRTYGLDRGTVQGPRYHDIAIDGARIIVTFDNTGDGLTVRGGGELTAFEVCGETVPWTDAAATILGDGRVAVSADKVAKPVAIRFGWHKTEPTYLENSAGLPTAPFRAGTPGDYDPMVMLAPESKDYQIVYELDLSRLGSDIHYQVDRSADAGPFSRVAYYLQLEKNGKTRFIFVSMDAFTDDATKLGVPTASSGIDWQRKVEDVSVTSNVIKNASNAAGNIEFWPNNYNGRPHLKLPGASGGYDFDDSKSNPVDGYGSMQVHLTDRKETIFALNHWRAGHNADLGIGNAPTGKRDWTFSKNADQYQSGKLRVLVLPRD